MSWWSKAKAWVSNVGNKIGDVVKKIGTAVVTTVKKVGTFIKGVADTVAASVKAVLKNPLPMLETFALTFMGVPYNVASAIVTVANGGDWKKAVLGLGMGYLNTVPGIQQSTWKQVLISSSGSAAMTALSGGTKEQIAKAAIGGAVGGYIGATLTKPVSQGGYGLDPKLVSTKIIANSTTAATNAILQGKPVGEAIVSAAAVTYASNLVRTSFDKLTSQSTTLQAIQKNADAAKAALVAGIKKISWATDAADKSALALENDAKNYRNAYLKAQQMAELVEKYQGIPPGYTEAQVNHAITTNLENYKNAYEKRVLQFEETQTRWNSAATVPMSS